MKELASKSFKELRELHAEMLKVKKEVTQVVPSPAPPTTPPPVPIIVPLEEEDGGDDGDITPIGASMMMRSVGPHHGALEVPDMEADDGETPDDCMAQVKRVKATPCPTFEQTCNDIVCTRKPCLQATVGGNSIVMGVQEASTRLLECGGEQKQKQKEKKKSDVLQVNKAVSSKKDPVFEATSKTTEKKGSLCCFDHVPQGTKMPFFSGPFFVCCGRFLWCQRLCEG